MFSMVYWKLNSDVLFLLSYIHFGVEDYRKQDIDLRISQFTILGAIKKKLEIMQNIFSSSACIHLHETKTTPKSSSKNIPVFFPRL